MPVNRTPIRRTRLLAACVVLIGLAFVQTPGFIVPDTKLDLVTAPADWLARALHVWDGEGGFGQVQNQAHGYLWPMGPFFLLLGLLDLPGWVVQRLWQALVLCVAMAGSARLARLLGVRTDLACLVAGFAYALSPRMLTSLGPISVEVWPSAVAPWVLLPLVRGSEAGSPRRAAAWSAVAVAMVGGVNAAASFAVIPLALLWILTRTGGPRRRALLCWWLPLCGLATAWWIVPLLVMGAYSPPFLDFTETAAVTTFPTTLFDTLRGTSDWVPYADLTSVAGNELIRTSWLAIYSGVVVLVGLVGLLDRRTPHRTFLVLGLLSGVLMVTAGHHGAVQGWFAPDVAAALDGVLAPLRNVHKFDLVLRLPLVLGLAFVVDRCVAAWRSRTVPRRDRVNAGILVAAVTLSVVGAATPAVAGRVEPSGPIESIPEYWQEAAAWVDRNAASDSTLLVPGSPFGRYLWGDPRDEPFQWLAHSRWAVRSVGNLAEPGFLRLLDGIERRFAEGHGSAGLTAALRRAGIRHLVVRNDLRAADDIPSPALVHQALAQSPGLARVASFGPDVGGPAEDDVDGQRRVFDGGRQAAYPAVEVYAVGGQVRPASTVTEPTVLAGGPDDLADLLDEGTVGEAPVRFATDVDAAETRTRPRRVALTDGLRMRERQYARIHDGLSATIAPGDVRRTSGRVREFQPGSNGDDRWSTTARLVGARSVSASSSASDATAIGGSERGRLPYAAVDAAPDTAWSTALGDEDPWWRVDLDQPRSVSVVTVRTPEGVGRQRLRVVTTTGASEPVVVSAGGARRLSVPGAGRTPWVRVEAVGDPTGLALAEVEVPGLVVDRVLDLPRLPAAWGSPDLVSLRADRDGRTGCAVVSDAVRCAAGTARTGEDGPVLRRSVPLAAARSYDVRAGAVPRAGAALDGLILRDQPVTVRVSSTAVPDPRAGAVAMVDGAVDTAWLAAPDDESPTIELAWLGVRPVSGITLSVARSTAASRPLRVQVRLWNGTRSTVEQVELDSRGHASLPTTRADRVTIEVLESETVVDAGRTGSLDGAPVGVGEVRLTGVPYLPLALPDRPVELPCGTGPTLRIGERLLPTSVTASPTGLLSGAPVETRVCDVAGALDLPAGDLDVAFARSDAFAPDTVTLTATDDPGEPVGFGGRELGGSSAVERTVDADAAGQVVVLRENANRGWSARQGEHRLRAVVVDGWQQGFRAEEAGVVRVRFAPDTAYRVGLLAGLACLLGLAAAVLVRGRGDPPALDEWRLGLVPGVALSLLVAGLLAGTVGLLVGIATTTAALLLRRRQPEAVPWLLAVPVLVTALGYVTGPIGSGAGWAGERAWLGYLPLVPLVSLAVVDASRRSGKSRLSRIAGRSTSR
ncbi:alpha-(1-_3)-arabinofuranosyltransferase domain-containing protein [Nocardioides nitrophenolicus]|uniref:alpha-(1->3)-arabinofuranosyltransferase domain-containing protein n=1 Tax=Nocardioides nitrophenolicus TaxID=60489 RepID=UPI0019564E60|nr:alpha-(1->3)-arabinofuranosyltransferase family protein [Nocardioides nitrophenolicus]MBM7515260.1 arabinofuranan 3-O-arabinosyltransferase [Nocardioides nitrophenolicus]